MSKKILGLDLGSNSIGWALLEEANGEAHSIIGIGSRIFTKAVEEKVPTPKNVKRRDMRLGRRVLQRRSRRKQRMLNYLVSLNLLSNELQRNFQPEIILNELGDPYHLRAKALDEPLTRFEFGRVLLHFVARRGFLSTKKQLAGDLIDDPDTIAYLNEMDDKPTKDKEEGAFKADISNVKQAIDESGARTLGEYLFKLEQGACKRNRSHEGGHLRTDRAMYKYELEKIWEQQKKHFTNLPDDFMADNKGIKDIIFYQRPLKLKKDRIGKCSLEPKNNRAATARLEAQRFRYLQDVNNLQYFEPQIDQWLSLDEQRKSDLIGYFERHRSIGVKALKKLLNLEARYKFNLEMKNLKGNITACEIRTVLDEQWDNYSDKSQHALVDDLLTIKKKSVLKKRLTQHWGLDTPIAIKLCLLEFEPSHSNLSLKAIKKLLPFLQQGMVYSKKDHKTGELGALQAAGYTDEIKELGLVDKLGTPIGTSNPIVNKAMQELKRVVNAIIKQYGKPDTIRIEMARDLEMNTKRYKENEARQAKNTKENNKAIDAHKDLNLGQYPSHDDKIKYRLWEEQGRRCAYSNKTIPLNSVFTANVEIDHILPFKKSLDDSYMNKVLCYVADNRDKGDRTPKDAWSGNTEKWMQITQAISQWKGVDSKVKRFYQTDDDLQKRDFISSQLNDTRYISKLALEYVASLVGTSNVSVTKGFVVSQIRYQWGFNDLIKKANKKDRTDHRHHAIDAVVIAATSRSLYTKAVKQIEQGKLKIAPPYPELRNELNEQLKHTVVSHATRRKLSGAFHKETGYGHINNKWLVTKVKLDGGFSLGNAQTIIDEAVRNQVTKHLNSFGNDSKTAFSGKHPVFHKDGVTLIKRVRILKPKTTFNNPITADELQQIKHGSKNKEGEIFKWYDFGNYHHVEIIQQIETGKYKGVFINMMEAYRRAKTGPTSTKENIINTSHGDNWRLVMSLHTNDLVSVALKEGNRGFYRVQVLDNDGGRLLLRLHTASTITDDSERIRKAIPVLMTSMGMTKHSINAIGILSDDQTNS